MSAPLPQGSGPAAGSKGPWPSSELALRLISGAALAVVSLGALWAGNWPFGVLVALLASVASWEWGRMVRNAAFDGLAVLHVAFVAGATLAASAGFAVPAAITLAVGAIVLIILRIWKRDALTGLGVLAIGIPAVSIAHLRADPGMGLQAVLFLFAVVWMTDIGGYLFGRSIGGPKLWPAVSPGKTWAGAAGGLILAALAGALAASFFASRDIASAMLLAVMLGIAAEGGDLIESAMKRRFRLKDTSALIPGHGGVLDRVDGLLAAALVATLFAMLRDPTNPAAGLLVWN
jgi:phosphatidate cytidylyltransferase